MNTYRYMVTVEAETDKQADQVMAERCYHDEDYGFDYSIDFDFHNKDVAEPEFVYTPTHRSIQDGSDAMAVDVSGIKFALMNEDGECWEADPMEWKAVDPENPYGYMEGVTYA